MSQKLRVSICMPIYRGSNQLGNSLGSIFRQNFDFHELIIGDNTDLTDVEEVKRTNAIIASFNDKRIRHVRNKENLGYARNLKNIVSLAEGDILFLMAHDDILSMESLRRTHDAFLVDPEVGVVTRPYYWFMGDMRVPVRAVYPYDEDTDALLTIFDGERAFKKIFESIGQLSGLAYRRAHLEVPFGEECFTAHIYPFAGVLRRRKCVFLKDFTVAVGIEESHTRSESSIYDLSPASTWLGLYETVFAGPEFERQRAWGRKHLTGNFVGLAQLRNFARPGVLRREILFMAREYPANLLNPAFYLFSLGSMLIPRWLLRRLVDAYKNSVAAKDERLKEIRFNY